jgi:hypothetical protein
MATRPAAPVLCHAALFLLARVGAYPEWDGVNFSVSWDLLSGTSEDGAAEVQIMQPEPGQLIIPDGEEDLASFNVELEWRVGSQGDELMDSNAGRFLSRHVSTPALGCGRCCFSRRPCIPRIRERRADLWAPEHCFLFPCQRCAHRRLQCAHDARAACAYDPLNPLSISQLGS